MNRDLKACMGGWCAKRDHCPHFHAENRRQPAERLCVPGADGVGIEFPIVIRTPAGAWERVPSRLQPADPVEAS